MSTEAQRTRPPPRPYAVPSPQNALNGRPAQPPSSAAPPQRPNPSSSYRPPPTAAGQPQRPPYAAQPTQYRAATSAPADFQPDEAKHRTHSAVPYRQPSPVDDELHSDSSTGSAPGQSTLRSTRIDTNNVHFSDSSRRRNVKSKPSYDNSADHPDASPQPSPTYQSHSHASHSGPAPALSLSSYMRPSTRKRLYRFVRTYRVDLIGKLLLSALLLLFILRFAWQWWDDSSKRSGLTIFSLLHDMTPDTLAADRTQYAFQYAALMSWALLVPGSNILVFVDSEESCSHLYGLVRGLQCFARPAECWHEQLHRPYLHCVFDSAHSVAATDTLVYVNSDIVLDRSLTQTIDAVEAQNHKRYVLVAARSDTTLTQAMVDDYNQPDFLDKLAVHAKSAGQRQPAHPIDVFVYKRSALPDDFYFPAFLAGVYKWDQWFLSQFILDDTLATIDVSEQVLVVHLTRKRAQSTDVKAMQHNDALIRSLGATNAYKIGTIDNAPLRLAGQCPHNCSIERSEQVSDLILFTKRASKEGYLVVLTVNSGYVPLALNWVCSAERIHFTNYILIAEDKAAAAKFKARGVPVILRANAPDKKEAADYGSVAFQETMTFRTEFLMSVLSAGYHFVTADMDGLWLDDPISYFDHTADLQGQMHKETKISGGFVVVRASTYGKFFWNKVIECQRENAAFLLTAAPGSYEPSKYTEQYCINELSRGLASQPLFRRNLLDPYVFPDGLSFFDEHNSQLRGVAPAIIHNNWIKGAENKLNRLKEWSLHSADEDAEQCLQLVSLAPPQLDGRAIRIKLRVFTYNRPDSLRRLLASLSSAWYDGEQVALEISVDHPVPMPESDDVQNWQTTKAVAAAFEWPHGNKSVIEQEFNIGLVGQWTTGWQPAVDDDSELIFFIEDDVQVSPAYYRWLRAAIDAYYVNGSAFDPRMFGISLQRQNRILGETHEQQYGSKIPADVLGSSTPLYRYQLLGTWGTLFFPMHWRLFQQWLAEKSVSIETGESRRGFKPCVPTLHSNTWYLEQPAKTWSQWFIRFAYEKGWYSLYANYQHDQALVVNHREPGLNSKYKKDPTGDLLANLTARHLTFPPLSAVPIYDFHFNRIVTPDVLSWRQAINNEKYVDQCWTIGQLQGLLRERQLAREAAEAEKQRLKDEARKAREAEEKKKKEAEKKAKAAAALQAAAAKKAAAAPAAKPAVPGAVPASPAAAPAAAAATPVAASPATPVAAAPVPVAPTPVQPAAAPPVPAAPVTPSAEAPAATPVETEAASEAAPLVAAEEPVASEVPAATEAAPEDAAPAEPAPGV